jgi:phosphoglycolate phosphatase
VAEALVAVRDGFRWDDCDGYLFDIDGTLLHAQGGVHTDAFSSSVEFVMGHPLSIAGVPVHGSTDTGILRDAFRQAEIADEVWQPRVEEILTHMRQTVLERRQHMSVTVMPGVLSLLDYLKGRGKVLGVATGNLEQIGWLKIEIAGLRDYFTFGGFSDRHALRSDMIANAQKLAGAGIKLCVVGDTPSDNRSSQGQWASHHCRGDWSLFLRRVVASRSRGLRLDARCPAAGPETELFGITNPPADTQVSKSRPGPPTRSKTFPRKSIHTEISPLRCASVEMTKGRAALPWKCFQLKESV